MTVVASDQIVTFDVDDTLVMWGARYMMPGPGKIEIVDPYNNSVQFLEPHQPHIDLMKKYKAQGYTVIVWSAGGYKWAEAVVLALGIRDLVTMVISKPVKFVDDLPAQEVLGTRVYIDLKAKKDEVA